MRHGRREFRPAVTGLEARQLLSTTSNPLTTVATFKGSQQSVLSAPVIDSQGNLYGTTSAGGEGSGKGIATVYEIPAGTDKVTTLASFNGRDGYGISGVTLDARDNLYGTIAGEGGTIGNGQAFEIAKGTTTVTTLASFDNYGGQFPQGLITDAAGDHFGTAAIGGSDGVASAYEIPAGTQSIVPIAQFQGTAPAPNKGLVMDAQGNLYGTNAGGGEYGVGSVFEIAKGSNSVTPLASFEGINGAGISGVTLDAQGNLYGTTSDDGLYGDGTVFEIAKGSNTATTLATFNGLNGTTPDPLVGIVRDAQGNLYGTTESGGANGYGTVFEIPVGTTNVVTIANFTSSRQSPVTGLVLDGQGDLYGTTVGTSTTGGTVFKVTLNNTSAKK